MGYREIPLTQSKVAIVDIDDYEELSKYKWYANPIKKNYYGTRDIYKNKKKKRYYMHRVIMKVEKILKIDHKNGNTLDNRKSNLRVATPRQNGMNKKQKEGGSSKYKGVYRRIERKTWTVEIEYKGKGRTINGIKNEEVAGLIYDLLAYDWYEEYARYNFEDIMKALPILQMRNK